MAISPRAANWFQVSLGIVIGVTLASSTPWASGDSQQTSEATSIVGKTDWPAEFGADDQRGAINRISPVKVVNSARLIQRGQIYQLGRQYEHGLPIPGKRHFSLTIPDLPTGSNDMVSNDELFNGKIGQVGTQFDGLGHAGVRIDGEGYFYNGNRLSDFGNPYGLQKPGVDNVGVFFTRGIFLDVCALRGNDRLPAGYVISPDELLTCLEPSNLEVLEDAVVLIRTGHGKLWMKDNETYGAGEPGIGLAAAKFLPGRKVSMIGADTWAIEAVPHDVPIYHFPCSQWDLTKNGVYHVENLDLEPLAADGEHGFCFQPTSPLGRNWFTWKSDRNSII